MRKNEKFIMSAVLASTALFLTACQREQPVSVSVENLTQHVIVTDVKKPKHFRIYVRDTVSGEVFKLRSTKHCSQWRNINVGDSYTINQVKYTYADGRVESRHYPSSCELAKNPQSWR